MLPRFGDTCNRDHGSADDLIGRRSHASNDSGGSGQISTSAQNEGLEAAMSSSHCTASTHGQANAVGLPHNRHLLIIDENLANIASEFPAERDKSDDHGPEAGNEYQDPMWLMAGLAERGWMLQRSKSGKKAKVSDGRLAPTALHPEEEWLFRKWTPQALQVLETEQTRYFQHGSLGSKCDVADELDPIQRGLATLERAEQLFQTYWERIHPQWAMLDPSLHTLMWLRRCAYKLMPSDWFFSVFAAGARSIDIIQAHILLCRWGPCPKTRLDEQRWMRAAMFHRMAIEIGLHVPRRYDNNSGLAAENVRQLRCNDLRTRVYLILNEYRFYTFSGRQPSSLAQFELTSEELEEITPGNADALAESVVSLYCLCLFDRDVRRRLEHCQIGVQRASALDAELAHIRNYLEHFIQQWCPDAETRHSNWHLHHDALCSWLLLAIHVARVRFQSTSTSEVKTQRLQDQLRRSQQEQQQLLVSLSIKMFEEALKVPSSLVNTHRASIMPFAASVIIRLSKRRDLVLRTALRMAGEPGKPTVRTFVRDAGRQMLVMLQYVVPGLSALRDRKLKDFPFSTNKSRQPSPPLPQNEAAISEPSFQNDPTSNAGDPAQIAHDPLTGRLPVAQPGSIPAQALPSLPPVQQDHEPSMDADHMYQNQPMFDTTFAFNFTDFPYIPEPAQTNLSPQGSLCPPWTSTELDSWIGTATAQPFPLDCHSADRSTFRNAVCEPHGGMSLNGSYCPPLDGPFTEQQISAHGAMAPTWGVQRASPSQATQAVVDPSSNDEACSAQRKVLLAAVDRLVQLATLMQ
ncbi:hypothetical protein HII31_05868 [Pseudocercospora fuligena]|uniref:Transcription factor domain-containing protein n=1 Tax=Pseudocercospora fuligena TaxID=685502 RepID=A0A8H6VIG5_9PEZI|nr:hypothetical protein HII31_05868 [Pseudocercospora fuligena]